MGKVTSAILIAVVVVSAVVLAGVVEQAMFPNQAEVEESQLVFYLNGLEWANGTTIDWGKVHKSTSYFYEFNATNLGNMNVTLTMICDPPAGWLQSWPHNNTLLCNGTSLMGNLVLQVPASATSGLYSWNMTVQAGV